MPNEEKNQEYSTDFPSIEKRLDALELRIQRIEDAITAKGIKFIQPKREYDWIRPKEVGKYVYELVGIRRGEHTGYDWLRRGLKGSDGKQIFLRHVKHGYKLQIFIRKLWVREFLDKVRKDSAR